MVYIFECGRMVFGAENLYPEDENKYVAVDQLPDIPQIDNKVGYCYADLQSNTVKIGYFDIPEPLLDIGPPFIPSAELRAYKLQEVNAACQAVVYAGIDVETDQGMKHFSLTEHDQIELTGLFSQVKDGRLTRRFPTTRTASYAGSGALGTLP